MVGVATDRDCAYGSWNYKDLRMKQGCPFRSVRDYETIVNLIAHTTTAKGLKVTCKLDRRKYPTGRKVSDEEMMRVNVARNKFHGEWNYEIKPHFNT